MKKDLFTAIVTAILGALIAFFVTNFFVGPVENVTIRTIESSVNANLAEPDPEVFNYKALNPTVEVYVGDCDEYNEFGECAEVESDTGVDIESQRSE